MEIWQTIIQLILLPTSIVAVLAFVMREIFKSYLSMDIEKYKTELQTDLESHKAKLKAEYDASHYEFQTKFSLFHQRKAEKIEALYVMITQLGKRVEHAYYKIEKRPEETNEVIDLYHGYIDYYIENQIYFDDDLCEIIEQIRDSISNMTDRYLATDLHKKDGANNPSMLPIIADAGNKEIDSHKKFRKEFPELRKKIRDEFKKSLSATKPIHDIDKK